MIKELEKDNGIERDISEVISELERAGDFSANIFPVDWECALPVTEDFPYIPKGKLRLKYFFTNLFIIKPFTWWKARFFYRVKVIGKSNLGGIESAIITSNHIDIFDCLMNAFALRPKRVKSVAAEFNNRRGRFGGWMRAGGMLPLSSNRAAMRKLNESIEYYLKKGEFILFYPEQSMWPLYEKPRPFKTGAFHYAAKHSVPVVPIFIALRTPTNEKHKAQGRKYFTINILEPIKPDKTLPLIEQTADLAKKAYDSCVKAYESAYGKPLEYKTTPATN